MSLRLARRGSLFTPDSASYTAPTYVAATEQAGTGASSVNIDIPAGVVSGHYQLCAIILASSTPTFGTVPANWSKIVDVTITYSDAATSSRVGLFESTTDTAAQFIIPQGGTARAWRAARAAWSGHGGRTTPPVQANIGVTSSPATPAITTSDPNSLVIGIGYAEEPDGGLGWGFTSTGSFTTRMNASAENVTESTAIVIADLLVATPSANITTNFGLTTASESSLISVVLRGAPA